MNKITMVKGVEKLLKREVSPHDLRSALKVLKFVGVEDFSEDAVGAIASAISWREQNWGRRFEKTDGSVKRIERAEFVKAKRELPMVRADGKVYGLMMVEYLEDKYGYSPKLNWIRQLYKGFSVNNYYDPAIVVKRTQDLADLSVAQEIKPGIKAGDLAPNGFIWGGSLGAHVRKDLPLTTIKTRLAADGCDTRKYSLIPATAVGKALTVRAKVEPLNFGGRNWEGTKPLKELRKEIYDGYSNQNRKVDYSVWQASCVSTFGSWAKTPKEADRSQCEEIMRQVAKRL